MIESCPPALDVIVDECLRKNPSHRYPSAAKLESALLDFKITRARTAYDTGKNLDLIPQLHTLAAPEEHHKGKSRVRTVLVAMAAAATLVVGSLIAFRFTKIVERNAPAAINRNDTASRLKEESVEDERPPFMYAQNPLEEKTDAIELKVRDHGRKTTAIVTGRDSQAAAEVNPDTVRMLNVKDCRLSGPTAFERFGRYYNNLREVYLTECTIGEQCFAGLARGLKQNKKNSLDSVGLRSCRLEKGVFEHIAEIPKLKHLTVIDCMMDDDDLAFLKGLKLKELVVIETQLTDSGLEYLHGMKSLATVQLSIQPGITVRGVRDLRKNLPAAKISVKALKSWTSLPANGARDSSDPLPMLLPLSPPSL